MVIKKRVGYFLWAVSVGTRGFSRVSFAGSRVISWTRLWFDDEPSAFFHCRQR
jgi:hypothetical protein